MASDNTRDVLDESIAGLEDGILNALSGTAEEHGTTLEEHTDQIDTKLSKRISSVGITRSLDTPFQISTDYLAWVSYVIQLRNSFSAAGTKTSTVDLLIDELATPLTNRGTISLGGTVAAILSLLGLTDQTTTVQLSGWVEPGHNVLLATSGSGSATLINQEERIFS